MGLNHVVDQAVPLSRMAPIAVTAYTATTAVGLGSVSLLNALETRQSGLSPNTTTQWPLSCWLGQVAAIKDVSLPQSAQLLDCRNNRLAWLALQQDRMSEAIERAKDHYGQHRIAIVVGTSTASIGATEEGYTTLEYDANGQRQFPLSLRQSVIHTPHSLGDFLQHVTQLRGPCVTVSTACSSSAKVFAQAARMIAAGIVDAALVGGVDTLCGSVLFGFNALQLVSSQPCRPFDRQRDGLSLGEAGGFALLERASQRLSLPSLWLLGFGESSDAHHMSAPHPEGIGALIAMRQALQRSGLEADQVHYLNLHGTATQANDRIEAAAVAQLFPRTLHASSTKAWTGHTLGAAGIVESVVALLALQHGLLPGTLNTQWLDLGCGPQVRLDNADATIDYAMNNSFGFGGNNCCLLFGRHSS